MTRTFLTIAALSALASQPANAADNFAEYGVNIGLSPFGAAFNASYNPSKKTTFTATMGGAPEGKAPFKPTVEDVEYELEASSSWMGFFINHRPFKDADWFRFNTGIGIGRIMQTLEDGDGNTYTANYTENPVGYFGVGFGLRPVKGFQYGLDLGLLHTGGPTVVKTGGDGADASEDLAADFLVGTPTMPNLQLSVGWGF